MSDESIDTGDVVLHAPSGETWTVAHVEGERLAWVGWPDGLAQLSDCTLVEKADEATRLRVLHMIAESQGSRGNVARRRLAELGLVTP